MLPNDIRIIANQIPFINNHDCRWLLTLLPGILIGVVLLNIIFQPLFAAEDCTKATKDTNLDVLCFEDQKILKISVDDTMAKSFKVPPQIEFQVMPVVKTQSNTLVVEGYLYNRSKQNISIIIFPVHNRTPFFIQLRENEKIHRTPHRGPPLPPEPPAPMKVIIPSMTRVDFTERINLEDYEYKGTPGATIEWEFYYWNEPHPRGTLTVTKLTPTRRTRF